MSSTGPLMRCCPFSSWRSPATDVRQTMPSNRFESQVIHPQFPGAVPFSRKQPPQPDFPKVPTGFSKVLTVFPHSRTSFQPLLSLISRKQRLLFPHCMNTPLPRENPTKPHTRRRFSQAAGNCRPRRQPRPMLRVNAAFRWNTTSMLRPS